MKKVNILCVGNVKEDYLKSGINEYLKRLSKYYQVSVIEVNEENIFGNNPSEKEREKIIKLEGEQLLSKLKGYVICLCIEGKQIDSVSFSDYLSKAFLTESEITFVIGGSYGLSQDVKQKANLQLSFSKFTFPHQLMRLILLEQIYRAGTIENNTPYHK